MSTLVVSKLTRRAASWSSVKSYSFVASSSISASFVPGSSERSRDCWLLSILLKSWRCSREAVAASAFDEAADAASAVDEALMLERDCGDFAAAREILSVPRIDTGAGPEAEPKARADGSRGMD